MAGVSIAQGRPDVERPVVGALVGRVVPDRSSLSGTVAALTNNVPPSPWLLELTTTAAPSFMRNASARPGWRNRPGPVVGPVVGSVVGPPRPRSPANRPVNDARRSDAV